MGLEQRDGRGTLSRRFLVKAAVFVAVKEALRVPNVSASELAQGVNLDCRLTLKAPTPTSGELETHLPQFIVKSIPEGEEIGIGRGRQSGTINTGRLPDNPNRGSVRSEDMRLRPYVDVIYTADCGTEVQLKSLKDEPIVNPNVVSAFAVIAGGGVVVGGLIGGVKFLLSKIPPSERVTPDGVTQMGYRRRYVFYDPIYGFGAPYGYRDREPDPVPTSDVEPIFNPPEAAPTGGDASFGEMLQGNFSEKQGQDVATEPTVLNRVGGEINYQDEDARQEAEAEAEAVDRDTEGDN